MAGKCSIAFQEATDNPLSEMLRDRIPPCKGMRPPLIGASRSAAFGTRDETERNAIRVITSFITPSRSGKDRRGLTMSDTRFDGKKIHKANSASQAIYDIRGKYIHEANSASQPVYEILAVTSTRRIARRSRNSRSEEIGFTRPTARARPSMKSADQQQPSVGKPMQPDNVLRHQLTSR